MKEKKYQYKRIVFISEMRNPKKMNASSTQIMTRNLLFGFNEISKETIFIPILDSKNDYHDVKEYYSNICDKMIYKKCITHFKSNAIGSRISMLLHTIFRFFVSIPKELAEFLSEDTILVSHSPSIDGALICEKIKHKYPRVRYVQYWGDPIALSLITPEQYTYKRSIQKFVEKVLHKKADKIVFGTKSLYDAQLKIFPEIKSKSSYVEVSYSPDSFDSKQKHEKPIIGYFGNYYSNIRNILPFYKAACRIKNAEFAICGNGDIKLEPSKNIKILSRVSQSEIGKIENECDILVCILNKVGIQIPGKIFYQTNTNKDILVIVDGLNKEEIKIELSMSNRFYFAENDSLSISKELNRIISKEKIIEYDKEFYSPKRICLEILKQL